MKTEEAPETPTSAVPAFEPKGLGKTIFDERYAQNGETWTQACDRVAHAVSRAEVNGKADLYQRRFYEQLSDGKFMPGGRIWYGAGRKKQQLLNCFVASTEDSIEGWGTATSAVMAISSKGGGVGLNFSPIRPRGYPIGGMGGTATGAVSLMRIINSVGDEIKDGGGRRAALMMCLDVNHPDIEEFLQAKIEVGQLSNANISLVIPPDLPTEEFVRLVQEDGEIPLRFNGVADREGRTVSAKKLWATLVENAWRNGEPGVLNGYLANKMNSVSYHWPLISTNPCGEIWLPAYGCCCLGALVLPRFVVDGKMDWDALEEGVRLGLRFLDNVLDVNQYPLPEIERVCKEERRVGLGTMGLHSMLLDLGMRYNSEEAFEFVDKLFSFIKNTAYDTSATLAAEKGPFPAFRPEFADTGFVKTLKPALRRKLREYGSRFCAALTEAPTGTTAMVHGVTGGIETTFSPLFVRRRRIVDAKQRESIAETLVVSQEYTDHPDLVQGAYDVPPRDHMRMQAIVQKHHDNAVSKTINMPKDFPVDELSDLWLEFLPQLKGTTFYREGSRETADSFEPMKHVPVDQMTDTLLEWTEAGRDIDFEDGSLVDDCGSGGCEVSYAPQDTEN